MPTYSAGRQVAVKAGCKSVHFSLDGCPLSCYFSGSAAITSGHFVHKSERRTRARGLSYTPCLLMNPGLRLRLHAMQAQSCFPAASNTLALSGGNGIFTATPTERITHYTLQAKSCAKGVPFGNPFLSECVATLPPKRKISGCNLLSKLQPD